MQHSASECLVEVSLFALKHSQKRNFKTFNLLSARLQCCHVRRLCRVQIISWKMVQTRSTVEAL